MGLNLVPRSLVDDKVKYIVYIRTHVYVHAHAYVQQQESLLTHIPNTYSMMKIHEIWSLKLSMGDVWLYYFILSEIYLISVFVCL